jgi:ribosomal protein S18 acetylase RimI-like enzyme
MNIREASEKDAESIAMLHSESWRVAYRGMLRDDFLDGDIIQDRLNLWQQRLSSPKENQLTLVAHEDQEIIGFACAFGKDHATWGTLLDNLHVNPERKRQRIGQHLMKEVSLWANHQYPKSGLYLWVLEGNHPARKFYEKLGAKYQEQELWAAPGGGNLISLRYVWMSLEPLLAINND